MMNDLPEPAENWVRQLEWNRRATNARQLSGLRMACYEAIKEARIRREVDAFLAGLTGRGPHAGV
jgi:hypothetical protein